MYLVLHGQQVAEGSRATLPTPCSGPGLVLSLFFGVEQQCIYDNDKDAVLFRADDAAWILEHGRQWADMAGMTRRIW